MMTIAVSTAMPFVFAGSRDAMASAFRTHGSFAQRAAMDA